MDLSSTLLPPGRGASAVHPCPALLLIKIEDLCPICGLSLRIAARRADELGMSETTATATRVAATSRAVTRRIEPGNLAVCSHCNQPVKFAAKVHKMQVIANVYVDGRWDRVEHFHDECYAEADTPYGEAADAPVRSKMATR
jgi:hypothetical protein